eukprot:CAMPEP_0172535334 /NCGR_PEP_ID=MMETSP1067-20121228/7392_1 /TAXON_ID=265564 ORGANISM="Thalassiosira punctigera, Strain Tpunct2005C2" /NCGR_SAMPLE_ID=MMETSP1067 /ASSEMBLY_ACC=CAM_ASM_000444 /LENGTH=266 /DNA_ID=CAMNT_0013320265 /DNA_START=148 /DNA_END=948 /DNA_ORIENTATION=+
MKFSDISKPSKDLLGDDYTSSVTLKAKGKAGPIGVTIETERSPAGTLSSKVGGKFSYAGLNFDKLQGKADGSTVLETSLVPCTGCKMTFKANKGADLGIEYTAGSITTTGSLDVLNMSKLSASSICVGVAPGVNVGGDLSYNISGDKGGLSSYNMGASYSNGPLFASVTSASKFSQFNVGVLYKVNSDLSLASSTTHSASKSCDVLAVGGSYSGLSLGTVKAKLGSNGVTSACLVSEVAPKVNLTASGSISGGDLSTFKYGFGITM